MTVRLAQAFRRDKRGAVAVEFAILGLMFFTLIFAILEIALVFLSQIVLDNAVVEVGRKLQTGELQQKSISQSDLRKMLCAEASPMLACNGIMIDLRSYATFAAVPTTVAPSGTTINTSDFGFDAPAASSIGALRAFYKWPLTTTLIGRYLATTSDNARVLVGTAVFKAEPF